MVFAEPNWFVYTAQTAEPATTAAESETAYAVDDPLYAELQWSLQRSNFSRAWQQVAEFAPTAPPIQVAVVDTGIDFEHPEFAGRLLPGYDYVTRGATPPIDAHGHGTHVAGLIAALANNAQGIAGSGAYIMIDPRRVFDETGSGHIANVAQAIRDAADNGARIINLSMQAPNYSADLEAAVEYARSRGVLLVAAAGNGRLNPADPCRFVCYPARFPSVVAVASVTTDNQPAGYSAAGPEVDIAAGGGDANTPVLSTWPATPSVLGRCTTASRVEQGGAWYCKNHGTSMAAPQVSAAAALLLAMRPTLTPAEVEALLYATALPLAAPADRVGVGLVNVEAAVRTLLPSDLTLSPQSVFAVASIGSAPITVTLALANPSLEPMVVTGNLVGAGNWFSATNFTGATFVTSIRRDQPAYVTLAFSPTALVTGTYTGELQLDARRTDQSRLAKTVPIALRIGGWNQVLFLPLVNPGSSAGPSVQPFTWETGANEQIYVLGESGLVEIGLPFPFPASGPFLTPPVTYARAVIAADGYLLFPEASVPLSPLSSQNDCLPQLDQPLQTILGWWADLNAGAPGAEIATFQPSSDRFVVEFRNVASAASVSWPYRVTFQIVLFQNGDVGFNYLAAPAVVGQTLSNAQPKATVGVQARAGLFRNQVACITDSRAAGNGLLPASRQSILIQRQEVY